MAATADGDLAGLCREFPDFDRGLVEGMLADQGGDVPEVHACLRVYLSCLAPLTASLAILLICFCRSFHCSAACALPFHGVLVKCFVNLKCLIACMLLGHHHCLYKTPLM